MMERKKKAAAAIAGLAAVAAIGGVFAYWNKTSTIDNPFDTKNHGSTVVEDFRPADGEDWQPGVDVKKGVTVSNTGDTDLIVRARLDETWTRKGEKEPYKDSGKEGYDVYTTDQKDASDGLTAADGSVVAKKFGPNSTDWVAGSDGWYYYKMNLGGGKVTPEWLDSVELLNDADMGKKETKYYVATDAVLTGDTVWHEYDGTQKMPAYLDEKGAPCGRDTPGAKAVLHNKTEVANASAGEAGYSSSDYTLRVTVQTVQATQEAVDALFGDGSTFLPPAGTDWTVK